MKSWCNRSGNKKRKIIFFILIGVIIGITILGVVLFRMNCWYVWLNASRIKELETDKTYSAYRICDNGQIVCDPDLFFSLKNDGTYIVLEGSTDEITEENYGEYFGEANIVWVRYMKGRFEKKASNYDLLESETGLVTAIFEDYEEVKEHRPNLIRKQEVGECKEDVFMPNIICKDEQGWKVIYYRENQGEQYNIEYLISEGKNEKLPESVDEFLADYQ